MADIELVIKIPEEYYKAITEIPNHQCTADMLIIKNGTPIHNVTNGDIVMAFFPNEHDFETDFDATWWNSPYQKGGKEWQN